MDQLTLRDGEGVEEQYEVRNTKYESRRSGLSVLCGYSRPELAINADRLTRRRTIGAARPPAAPSSHRLRACASQAARRRHRAVPHGRARSETLRSAASQRH